MKKLKMKKLISVFSIVFFVVFSANAEIITIEINKTGGRTIVSGESAGQIGYKTVKTEETKDSHGNYTYTANCSGKGGNLCPERFLAATLSPSAPSPLTPIRFAEIESIIYEQVDIGCTSGAFLVDGLSCTWEDGSKEIDDEGEDGEADIYIYSYKLRITWEVEDVSIQVSPNPAQDHINVRFSTEINATMSVKIVDIMGNIRWSSDMYVMGNEATIDGLATLQAGTYYIVCANADNTVSASFLKQ